MQSLHAARAQGDDQLVQLLVHTVKGVGGNLGATELASAALALEEALKSGDADEIGLRLAAFEKNISLLLASIHTLEERGTKSAEPPTPSFTAPAVDRERLVLLVRELRILLDANNMTALGVWEELKPLLADVNTGKLTVAMSSLKFKEAGNTLQSIAESLKITL
jgi:HPt (histidine-containing phosphotransfer) domain-containing protein